MSNKQIFSPNGPPGATQELQQVWQETQTTGLFRPTIGEVAIGSDAASAAASITAAAGRICAMDRPVITTNATTPATLTAKDSGTIFIGNKSSGNQTFTLPAAQTAGLTFTFICGNAAGEILINPVGTDTISVKASEGGANVTTVTPLGIKNTAATNVLNDYVTLYADGVSQWWMVGESGTWATQ